MNCYKNLLTIINYIEENLKSEIETEDFSEITGFSIYHFYRLFSCYVGMPVAAYITNRRLHHAIYSIQKGNKSIDIALQYGFNTYSGFYKAFRREFGCSPTKYLELNTVKRPTPIDLKEEAEFMLNQREINQLLSNWNIEKDLEIKDAFTAGGSVKLNDTWIIGKDYIFKTGKNVSGLRTHIRISKELEKSGMASSVPIKTIQDDDFILKDDRYYVLTKYIKGKFLSPEERYAENGVQIAEKYGAAIGNLHKILKKHDDIEVNDSNLLNIVLDWALPKTKKIMKQWGCPLPDEFYEDYIENFTKLYDHLPRHIIHRDANPSNIIFYKGEVSGFIDFEISERNVRIFDPCYCATGILSEASEIEGDYDKWEEILIGIISGYDKIVKITEIEKRAIPYVIYSIQMIFIAWLLTEKVNKNLAVRNREMLQKIYQMMKNKDVFQ